MFTKNVRVGTRVDGVARPITKPVTDWSAVGGAIVIGLIVLVVLGSL
jgi:hypothetical protein